MDDYPFQVGGHYANWFGRYEVSEINAKAGNMIVCSTESGEKTELSVD